MSIGLVFDRDGIVKDCCPNSSTAPQGGRCNEIDIRFSRLKAFWYIQVRIRLEVGEFGTPTVAARVRLGINSMDHFGVFFSSIMPSCAVESRFLGSAVW